MVRARINGEPVEAPEGTPLLSLLRDRGVDAARVAVERNGEVVPRARQSAVVIRDGDTFEVVAFVGGG